MDCHHPDIEQFIDIKKDLDKVTSANISIRFTDDFMKAVLNDEDFELSFTREETGEVITKTIKAREVFKKLSDNNWDMGEPGCLFWDRISSYNLLSNTEEFSYAGTNPCAEEPLPSGGSCLLGSINLAEFVTKDGLFDYESLESAVKIAVRALNDVLDEGLPLHPLSEQRDSVRDWRQIGLGIMGLADMLIKLKVTYGSQESIDLCNDIGFCIANAAIKESSEMAKQFGVFPKCNTNEIITTGFFEANTTAQTKHFVAENGLRNSQLLTIAPTGTLSTMLGISGGIEPIFANSYTRTTKSLHGEDVTYKVYTPIVQEYMTQNGVDNEDDLPEYFVTASTIHYQNRIAMQSVWQNHIDASISSTVNLPNDATKEDIFDLYVNAWASGLKGITVFRDGCARTAILNTSDTTETKAENNQLGRGDIIVINDDVVGLKRKLMTGCGSLHCAAFFDPITGELLEVYLSKGSTGGCLNSLTGLSRMISLAARAGVSIYEIVDQLESTGVCPSYAVRSATKKDTSKGSCCPVAIGRALLDMYNEMQSTLFYDEEDDNQEETVVEKIVTSKQVSNKSICPSCGDPLIHEGGCDICKSCGWSKCS